MLRLVQDLRAEARYHERNSHMLQYASFQIDQQHKKILNLESENHKLRERNMYLESRIQDFKEVVRLSHPE